MMLSYWSIGEEYSSEYRCGTSDTTLGFWNFTRKWTGEARQHTDQFTIGRRIHFESDRRFTSLLSRLTVLNWNPLIPETAFFNTIIKSDKLECGWISPCLLFAFACWLVRSSTSHKSRTIIGRKDFVNNLAMSKREKKNIFSDKFKFYSLRGIPSTTYTKTTAQQYVESQPHIINSVTVSVYSVTSSPIVIVLINVSIICSIRFIEQLFNGLTVVCSRHFLSHHFTREEWLYSITFQSSTDYF